MNEIKRVRIQTAQPRGDRFPGAVEEAFYVVEDDSVVLTDKRGTPIDKHRLSRELQPGQDPHSIAAILLRQWKKPKSSDFNRKIVYPKIGVA
jgi:hypothetical protein